MITQIEVDKILEQHPLLHYAGYGFASKKDKLEAETYLKENRERFISSLTAIDFVVETLKKQGIFQKGVNKHYSSYKLKHIFEHMRGDYISNGECIVGILLAGYKPMYIDYNVCFNLSMKSKFIMENEKNWKNHNKYPYDRENAPYLF